MGKWKLLLPLGAETVVEKSVQNALGFCARVILVTGFRGEELSRLFADRPQVTIVSNPEYAFGMFSSIRAGVREVRTKRFFVTLADMPFISPGIFRSLARLRGPIGAGGAARPFCRGMKGHPVLLPSAAIDKILQFDNSHTMQEVLRDLPLSRLTTSHEGVLSDIDSPTDYHDLTRFDDPPSLCPH